MSEAARKGQAPFHAAFLERLARASSPSSSDARLGHAAFLTLRLVDLLEARRATLPRAAFQYQLTATELCCRDLPRDSTERAHLSGLVRAAADAYRARDVQLLVPALLAYAHYLEDELHLSETLDVLDTTLRVGGAALGTADRVATRLRLARVLRKLNEFDTAELAYVAAGTLAAASGDRHSELLSRIGRANTVLGRGNLAEAERWLREVLRDAEISEDRDARARAHQGLAVALVTRGQPAEAIPHAWRAYQDFQDDPSRARALGDLAGMLLMIGDVEGAERALAEVVRRDGTHDVVTNALIELMNCASYRRDQLAFERWRAQGEQRCDSMPPNILADFYFKSGIGRARFRQYDRAERQLTAAIGIAEAAGLYEFAFRVERIRSGLRGCPQGCEVPPEAAAETAPPAEAVHEVSAALLHLAT
jgi:tetratricopeptide (TPR) repeat protein